MSNINTIYNLNILLHSQINPFPLDAILTFIHAYLLQSENHYVTVTSLSPCRGIYPLVGGSAAAASSSSSHERQGSSNENANEASSPTQEDVEMPDADDDITTTKTIIKTRKRKRDAANSASKQGKKSSIFSSPEEMDFKQLLGPKDQFMHIKHNLIQFLKENHVNRVELSAALSRVLCRVAKLKRLAPPTTNIQSRILVFIDHQDVEQQYVPVMNAIFAAQRMSVTIDACILGSQPSPYLQVACNQTGGTYLSPYYSEGLVQYLLQHFIIDADLRKEIPMAVTQETQHFPAVCFETKKTITQAFVCSVCLSIFSKKKSQCPTCGESFRRHLGNVGRQNQNRPPRPASSS